MANILSCIYPSVTPFKLWYTLFGSNVHSWHDRRANNIQWEVVVQVLRYILENRHNAGPLYLMIWMFCRSHKVVSIKHIDMAYVDALGMVWKLQFFSDIATFLVSFLHLPHTHISGVDSGFSWGGGAVQHSVAGKNGEGKMQDGSVGRGEQPPTLPSTTLDPPQYFL